MEYYDEDEQEQEVQPRVAIGELINDHPKIAVILPSLLTSGVIDVAVHFNPYAIFIGLFVAGVLCKESDFIVPALLPGQNVEEVQQTTQQVVEHFIPETSPYEDQSAIAKLRRIFYLDRSPVVATPQTKKELPVAIGKRENNGSALSLDRIAMWLETGKIDDTQFFDLLARLDGGNNAAYHDEYEDEDPITTVTRNAVTVMPKPSPEQDVSSQEVPLLLPGWTQETVTALPYLYKAMKSLDNALTALEISTGQRNRDFARDILKQQGLWKEGK